MTDTNGNKGRRRATAQGGGSAVAFLLTQVGAHAAGEFAKRLATLDITPPHAGILRALSVREGMSQQALCQLLTVMPSRLVVLLDELEKRKLVERRDDPEDRRSYALYLTDAGREMMESLAQIGREHNNAICATLTAAERATLAELLQRIATDQGLTPGVHPGYSRLSGRGKRSAE